MQVTEMRPFYTHKHLISLTLKHRPFISFRTLRSPLFLRSFSDALSSPAENSPSSGPGNGNSSSKDRRVWSVHDPFTGRLAPQRGQKEESGSGSGSGGDGRRTYLDEGERVYGNAKKAQSEGGSEASRSFDRRVEGFGEKGKGQGFWVCSHCCHREAQRWETCRVCMCTGTMKLVTESCNQTGGFGVAGNRYNVVEGSGSGFHKEVDNFSGERALEQMLSSGAKQEQEWASGGEAHRGMAHSGNEGHDLNIGMSSENVKISEDIVGNRLSELEVSEKALKQVGGGVHPLPLTMKPEVESASDDVTYVRLSSSGNRISDFHGSVEKANFAVANHEKGVEYFSSEGLGSREHTVPSSIRDQVAEALPLPKSMKQESESTSQNEIQMVSSNSGNRPDDLDIDRTEGSSKKAKLVSRAESRSDFDEGVKEVSRERAFRVVEKGSSRHGVGQEFSIGDILTTSMRKKKSKMAWVCKKCGHTEVQWWGSCKMCGRVGSMRQISVGDSGGSGDESGMVVSENGLRSLLPKQDKAFPMRLIDVNCGINKQDWRIPLSGSLGSEVARVLGGGIVPGSLVLVGGDPGVGKSTLLLQVASLVAEGQDIEEPRPVVYVSGEESMEQIGNRADRMGIETDELFLYSGTDVEDILEKTHLLSPRLLIVDSIQTVYLKGVTGSAGGVTQVKECTSSLLRYAKKTNIPVLLIGHVTKTGEIAGPQVLEHIVDVVLYLEGEKHTSHRLLRSIKNRFGSTDELGVFEMLQSGLQSVSNPSEMYLTEQYTDSDFLAGLAVAVVVDGTRTFVIEIQALCAAGCSRGSRHFNGVQDSRADMIISVLVKQAGLKLQESSIYLNVVSGVTLSETAGDLAIAAAICSSFLEFPIPTGIAFIGEIGLSGELRAVPRMDFRINTVAQLGYKKCIVPQSVLKSLKGIDHKEMQIIGCKNLKNVINTVFTTT